MQRATSRGFAGGLIEPWCYVIGGLCLIAAGFNGVAVLQRETPSTIPWCAYAIAWIGLGRIGEILGTLQRAERMKALTQSASKPPQLP